MIQGLGPSLGLIGAQWPPARTLWQGEEGRAGRKGGAPAPFPRNNVTLGKGPGRGWGAGGRILPGSCAGQQVHATCNRALSRPIPRPPFNWLLGLEGVVLCDLGQVT